MYGCNDFSGLVRVANGYSNGRSFCDNLLNGRVTITGEDRSGTAIQRVATFKDGQILTNIEKHNGETVAHIQYGKFKIYRSEKGREIVRFHKEGQSKHGLAVRKERLFDSDGVCRSWYKNGTLVRQKFTYTNRKTAYDWRIGKGMVAVKGPDGAVLYEIEGKLRNAIQNAYNGHHSVLAGDMGGWFNESQPFKVMQDGKPFYFGQYENRQRVGKWYLNGEVFYFERGVQIPEKLYLTPPNKLDPKAILKITNAQLRMALMSKIGVERIAKVGTEIHRDGDMRLYDIKGYDVRILRVRCTTTKAYYFLRVPKDSTKCEQARQWTFHVGGTIPGLGIMLNKPLVFKKET